MNLGRNRKQDKLPFSTGDSLRLCTEGLEALERFERRASPTDLQAAEKHLTECVQRYPSDMLPKFYLGSVKTLVGYRGLDDAVRFLIDVAEHGPDELKVPAQYNLAVAYIERYSDAGFTQAESLLSNIANTQSRSKDSEAIRGLIWSARANLLYIKADRIWRHRSLKNDEDSATMSQIPELHREFEAFFDELGRSESKNDRDLLADYWNALGTLYEVEAHAVPVHKAIHKADLAQKAKEAYLKALEYKVDWVDAKSNIARIYFELLEENATSRKLWEEILQVWPDGHYAHYNLGLIDRAEGKFGNARMHFEKAAPKIDEASQALQEMNDQAGRNNEIVSEA